MANLISGLTALTGGGATALDFLDGNALVDGDKATVMTSTNVYSYHLNATSGASENSPYVISPDSNAGTKRWILQVPGGAFSHVSATSSSEQTIATNTTTTVIYGTEETDTLSEYDNTTGKFTALASGRYLVSAGAGLAAASWTNTEYLRMEFHVNSVGVFTKYGITFISSATVEAFVAFSASLNLSATDYLEVKIRHTQGGDVNMISYSTMNFLTIDRLL